MLAHCYDPHTGEYRRSEPARPDPRETVLARMRDPRAGVVWMCPAHATLIAPPPPRKGFARVFDGSAWREIIDRRGEIWFQPTGEPARITGLGDPSAAGLTRHAPDWRGRPATRRALLHAIGLFARRTMSAA